MRGNGLAADRVQRVHDDVLSVVATLARQCQVIRFISATGRTGQDMFDRERVGGETRLTATVFTAFPGPVDHGSSAPGGAAGLPHTPGAWCPTLPSTPPARLSAHPPVS